MEHVAGLCLAFVHIFRFIKRKKFDDELVESSLAKSSSRAKGPSGVEPGRCSGSEPSSSEKKKVSLEGLMGQELPMVQLCWASYNDKFTIRLIRISFV